MINIVFLDPALRKKIAICIDFLLIVNVTQLPKGQDKIIKNKKFLNKDRKHCSKKQKFREK